MPNIIKPENQFDSDESEAPKCPDQEQDSPKVEEFGGPKGREPTRYGDWEKNGRCIDF